MTSLIIYHILGREETAFSVPHIEPGPGPSQVQVQLNTRLTLPQVNGLIPLKSMFSRRICVCSLAFLHSVTSLVRDAAPSPPVRNHITRPHVSSDPGDAALFIHRRSVIGLLFFLAASEEDKRFLPNHTDTDSRNPIYTKNDS